VVLTDFVLYVSFLVSGHGGFGRFLFRCWVSGVKSVLGGTAVLAFFGADKESVMSKSDDRRAVLEAQLKAAEEAADKAAVAEEVALGGLREADTAVRQFVSLVDLENLRRRARLLFQQKGDDWDVARITVDVVKAKLLVLTLSEFVGAVRLKAADLDWGDQLIKSVDVVLEKVSLYQTEDLEANVNRAFAESTTNVGDFVCSTRKSVLTLQAAVDAAQSFKEALVSVLAEPSQKLSEAGHGFVRSSGYKAVRDAERLIGLLTDMASKASEKRDSAEAWMHRVARSRMDPGLAGM